MTVREVAEYLRISPSTVTRRVQDGTIRGVRVGGTIRIPTSEVARVLQDAQERYAEVRNRDAQRRMGAVRERHPETR